MSMRDFDPDYYDDDYPDEGEEYVFDTYDQIIEDFPDDQSECDPDDDYGYGGIEIAAIESGLAFALAEEIKEAESGVEVDKNTDRENWDKVSKLLALETRHKEKTRLRPFEKYISDICAGKRPLFEKDDY